MTHLRAHAQRRRYVGAAGTVTMATAASQPGHLTFLTDSSVLLFPPDKQVTPPAQQRPPPTPNPLLSPAYPCLLFLLFFPFISCSSLHPQPSLGGGWVGGGLPVSTTFPMLSFQRTSPEVQVKEAGAHRFHLPSAANDIMKRSCRGTLVMISISES